MTAVCNTLGVSRSQQYARKEAHGLTGRGSYRKAEDGNYLSLIRAVIDTRVTHGYRRVTALVNRELSARGRAMVNHKRIYRIMHHNGLLLSRHTGRPIRAHDGVVMTARSNMRWCSDAFESACWSGERLRVAFSMDCCDREIISYVATTAGLSAVLVRDLMAEAIEARFGFVDALPHPVEWLSDNGPAYTARITRSFAAMMGLAVKTTPYYSPESNGMAEAFIKTFKRDYVHVNPLVNAHMVMEKLPQWFEDYNTVHPHKALKMQSPREYRVATSTVSQCPV